MSSVFLSVVNAEFSETLKLRTFGLRRAGYNVLSQPSFPHTATDTLQKLVDLMAEADCVVHLVGKQLGSFPNQRCIDSFLDGRSQPFLWREPKLRLELGDGDGISYTQWEAFLAIDMQKPLLIYTNTDPRASNHPQRKHLDRLHLVNLRADQFADEDLADRILADVHHHFHVWNRSFKYQKDDPEHPSTITWYS